MEYVMTIIGSYQLIVYLYQMVRLPNQGCLYNTPLAVCNSASIIQWHFYLSWLTFEGGFQANVRVKGVDFEYSCEGNACPFPREARDSAAAQMLTKFRSIAKNQPSNFGSCAWSILMGSWLVVCTSIECKFWIFCS